MIQHSVFLYRWLPDGQSNNGDFIIDEERKATKQNAVNITDTEYTGFWITCNEVVQNRLLRVSVALFF